MFILAHITLPSRWSLEFLGLALEEVTGPYLDGECATVRAALKRLDFQRHAVVVDAISAVNADPPVFCRVIKPDARREIVLVPMPGGRRRGGAGDRRPTAVPHETSAAAL